MSKEFTNCIAGGGRVRTIKHGKTKYQHICYLNGKSYAGEVKIRKVKRPK